MTKLLLLLRSSTVLTALLVTNAAVNCAGINDAPVVASARSSISLPDISVSTTSHDSRRSNHSSWWKAFDGIPFIMDRKPTRKLSKIMVSKTGDSSNHFFNLNSPQAQEDVVDEFHRILAPAFTNYADHTFQCPVTTTCPIVCVAEDAECPEDAQCAAGSTLCADGTCADPAAGEA